MGSPYKQILFDIKTPFLKDLEAESRALSIETGVVKKRKRKRFQATVLPIEESDVVTFLGKLKPFFQDPPSAGDLRLNNKPAREAVRKFMQLSAEIQENPMSYSHFNPAHETARLELMNESFILPRNSQFYRNKIENVKNLITDGRTFSFICVDPPWNNRFIKRKYKNKDANSGYETLGNDMLYTIKVDQLCRNSSLVAIWYVISLSFFLVGQII